MVLACGIKFGKFSKLKWNISNTLTHTPESLILYFMQRACLNLIVTLTTFDKVLDKIYDQFITKKKKKRE